MIIMPHDAVLFNFFLKDLMHWRVDIINFSKRVLKRILEHNNSPTQK